MKASSLATWLRWAVVGAVGLWLFLLVTMYKGMWKVEDHYDQNNPQIAGLASQLDDAKLENSKLSTENKRLQKLVDELSYVIDHPNAKVVGKFSDSDTGRAIGASSRQLYSKDHEVGRRWLDTNIKELYFYLFKHFDSNNATLNDPFANRTMEQLFALMAESYNFGESVDNAALWHRQSLGNLTNRIQKRLEELQNPSDCSKAKILLCDLNKGCGFGCQLHHVAYCFFIAAATERTLVFEGDGKAWRYSNKGWEAAFLPLGKCNQANSAASRKESKPWLGPEQTDRVVFLPIVDGLSRRPKQMPLAFPKQFADELLTHHNNPSVYFVSQFIWYLMRSNSVLEKAISDAAAKIPFGKGPIVGLQIRRTDKIGTEAAFHGLDEYMKWTEHWFRIEELRNDTTLQRKVFIATDEPKVFKEARDKYPHYEIYGDSSIAETAQMNSRYTDSSLFGVVIDIQMLSRCDYLVCTFSSQVCRMGFELMQVRVGDAGHRFHSLDDIYYYGGQHSHDEIAVLSHVPASKDEFAFKKGETIGIAGNHWDGFSKGQNKQTGDNGLYPSYKTRENWRIVDFPIFNGV
uniref:Alpha-(1,6)-fucosyltransferase n=2 Tax=Panagrellus redivivus TaxID=6233 RepID=A0A7E4V6P4_PANRE